jgi:hypothetical protein
MKTQYSEAAKAPSQNHSHEGLGKMLLAALRSLFRPAANQHVGMFAGSLLTYDSWSQPKVPH